MTDVGDRVTVRGVTYQVIRSRSAGDGKFFGKRVFTLEDGGGNKFIAYGKTVAHNSRLRPAEVWEA